MGAIKKFMAGHCENCPLCKHARANPDTIFGKVMALHGKICPFWRAWKEEYGQKQNAPSWSPGRTTEPGD